MNTATKRVILENWYLIDYSLFNTEPKKELSEDEYKSYLSSKGAFMSNLFEIYNLIKFQPKDQPYNNINEMIDYVEDLVEGADDQVKSMMSENKSIKSLREEVNNIGNVNGLTDTDISAYVVSKRKKAMILDSVLLKDSIKNVDNELLESWKFKVLYDSHKLFRDSLVDHCHRDIVDKINNS